jgi:ATP-dependent helicase HrpB
VRTLPIDPLLPDVVAKVASARALVLEAEPGAGKTTRVPWALHEARPDARIVVTEPRRLAARMAAHFVAKEHGERPGETAGYSVRFEEVAGPKTRIRYVTEGVLLRRLLADPELSDVDVLVLDEFHERHLETDLLLALAARLRAERRPELALVVMSATLDAGPIASFLGDAPRVRSEGRAYPLGIEHDAEPDERPLEKRVVSAVRRALEVEPEGDVLVFLPGAAEIRRATEALENLARERDLAVLPLHGDLTLEEQARAVAPASRRKVVLSTNVAESSVTIEGVKVVVDSGLARQVAHSAWTGLPKLATVKVSRASAIQRAGRAGRTGPGRVRRLYTRGDFEGRPEHDAPEIARADLSEALLVLRGIESSPPRFLTEPPRAALTAAEELLSLLGATGPGGSLSAAGRRMLELPLHPRLARIVVEGERRGVGREAALVAALVGERDIRLDARASFGPAGRRAELGASGPSDLLELVQRFEEAEGERFNAGRLRSLGLDPRSVSAVDRAFRQISRTVRDDAERPDGIEATDRALLAAIVTGFADRLARRRDKGSRELVMSNGRSARLSEQSVVHDAPLLVAIDVEERPGRATEVRWASAAPEDLLLELYEDRIELSDALVWDAERERVERVSAMRFGAVTLDETRSAAPPSREAGDLLALAARERPERFLRSDAALSLAARLALLAGRYPDRGIPADVPSLLESALRTAAEDATSFAELDALELGSSVVAGLSNDARRLLDEQTPERVRLAGGRTLAVHYEPGKPPWVESRLQDFFGSGDGPRILSGSLPLTLHLCAPNQRAVQVTSDLAGFWQRHYPTLRRELMRRYPRHAWPEDGRTAVPPPPPPGRRPTR